MEQEHGREAPTEQLREIDFVSCSWETSALMFVIGLRSYKEDRVEDCMWKVPIFPLQQAKG
jgi:hypothetical protein